MSSLNQVQLVGRLGQDPEIKEIAEGVTVANFSLATSERWTDKNGERQERTDWHRIVLWNKQAEIAGKYLEKGRLVAVVGKIEKRKWEDKEGKARVTTEIKGQMFQMLGGKGDGANEDLQKNFDTAQDSKPPTFGNDEIPF